MMLNSNLKKIIRIIISINIILVICSCKNNIENQSIVTKTIHDIHNDIDYVNYDVGIHPVEIIVPKNQSVAQSLSVLVHDNNGNLIVFDGGRVEDADYLCDIIKDKGGTVKYWFITHIHDDHIGALYQILTNKRTDIVIENLYFDFASFDWYFEKMGNDAGVYYLFTNAIKEYNEFLKENNLKSINIIKEPKTSFDCYFNTSLNAQNIKDNEGNKSITIEVLNRHYELDHDPINNTSIVYLVKITLNDKIFSMLILGDLGYGGGEVLFNNNLKQVNKNQKVVYEYNSLTLSNKLYVDNIDVVVLAHHGQNGINTEIYKRFKPQIVIWPTSKDIYENINEKYYTNDTKKVLNSIDSIKYQILSYKETALIS